MSDFSFISYSNGLFFKLNQSPTFILINVPVRRLYLSDVVTSSKFVSVRRLYQSNVCTSPTFVLSDLVMSDVCGSDVCTGTGGLLEFIL